MPAFVASAAPPTGTGEGHRRRLWWGGAGLGWAPVLASAAVRLSGFGLIPRYFVCANKGGKRVIHSGSISENRPAAATRNPIQVPRTSMQSFLKSPKRLFRLFVVLAVLSQYLLVFAQLLSGINERRASLELRAAICAASL